MIIDGLRALVKKSEDQAHQLQELDNLEQRLRKEEQAALVHLGGLGADKLSSSEEGGLDAVTRRKLQLLQDTRVKLELLPGVRAKARAELAGLRPKLRAAIDALSRHCEGLADAKLSDLHAKLLQDLSPVCGAGTERLKAAVLSTVLKSDLEQYRLAFRERAGGDDLVAMAEDRILLAQSFEQGLPCPHASDPGVDPVGEMVGAMSARGRF